MNEMNQRKEIKEAIMAGERALSSLRGAQKYLNSAKNWGLFDMLGGGFISSMMKHSKLSDAERCMETARTDLRLFEKEVKDVQSIGGIQIQVGDFLTFADFFFDGLIADYMVQSKIAGARREVDAAIQKVSQLLDQLKKLHPEAFY